ncbi:MAG: hypothetical protein MJ219_00295 [Mycoplasmoidaceae bacterium]|nr:hypothetical protein [Mycoplasmoidaceae bacterium]
MTKRKLNIIAIATGSLAALFTFIGLFNIGEKGKLAMGILALLLMLATIACVVLCFLNKKVKVDVDVGVEPIEKSTGESAPSDTTSVLE